MSIGRHRLAHPQVVWLTRAQYQLQFTKQFRKRHRKWQGSLLVFMCLFCRFAGGQRGGMGMRCKLCLHKV